MHKQIAVRGWVCEWISLDFQSWKCFHGTGDTVDFVRLCWLARHTLDIHSTDFRLRHAFHVIFPTRLSFPDFRNFFILGASRSKHTARFSTAIFQAFLLLAAVLCEAKNPLRSHFAICNHKWKISFFLLPLTINGLRVVSIAIGSGDVRAIKIMTKFKALITFFMSIIIQLNFYTAH